MRKCSIALCLFVVAIARVGFGAEKTPKVSDVLEKEASSEDARLKPLRTTNDKYHPWNPSATKPEWEKEAQAIRERVLVSNGLWPMPPATPIRATIHGKIDRDDYTIEKVFFQSYPGFYVTGNLYRPKKISGKVPGVLCPYGHWSNGRFNETNEKDIQKQLDQGAEKFLAGARYPLQARMAGLARLGCIAFMYDMVGRADLMQIGHGAGFADVEGELRLQNAMGLQTYDSIRALDFLLSLPEVDASRVAVTGDSGGGTQTFMLCAADPRPQAAFPAVMVSASMQGGCTCENCSYLRIGINNIALAALCAPRPMAMSGANDWTIDIETKGLPELRQVYGLFGKPDFVAAKAYPQFGHNYNQVAREMMYAWFNRHLGLNLPEPIVERDFVPLPPAELSVFDKDHPLPADAVDAHQLRAYMTKTSDAQIADLIPKTADQMTEYQRVIGAAARVLLDTGVPAKEQLEDRPRQSVQAGGDDSKQKFTMEKRLIGRKGSGESIPMVVLTPDGFAGTAVLWIDSRGKGSLFDAQGQPTAAVGRLLDAKYAVASADVYQTGEYVGNEKPDIRLNSQFSGYTWCYNRPLLADRVRDILTAIADLENTPGVKRVDLVGTEDAGPWVVLARSVAGNHVDRTVADLRSFSFGNITKLTDPMLLPGGLKYGGIGGLAALAAPAELHLAGAKYALPHELRALTEAYRVAGETYPVTRGRLHLEPESLNPDQAVAALLD